jgi:hypothetical protein
MSWMADFNFLIAGGDMRGAGDAYMKKGHGGNMVSPVKRASRRRAK